MNGLHTLSDKTSDLILMKLSTSKVNALLTRFYM